MTTADKELVHGPLEDSSLDGAIPLDDVDTKTAIYRQGDLADQLRLQKKSPALLVLRGAETGLRIALQNERVSLGRTIDADVVLNDKLISRQHCEILWDGDRGVFCVVDLGSTNGTFVNDGPVRSHVLQDGDKIFVGSTILKFVLEDEVDNESGQVFDQLMFQDDLTGLVVRRRFDSDLRVHLQSARALRRRISLLMMDMDGLKRVNDAHGHPVGAFVISQVGRMIGEICNSRGEACRYGGDEFIAYVLEADRDAGLAVGEEIRAAVRERVFRKDGLELQVSISIGVATFPDDADGIEKLTTAADEALYRAKEKGRDTVSL